MENTVLSNIAIVRKNIQQKIPNANYHLIAITKTFSFEVFKPLLDNGHIHFGENKVQEAENKWSSILSIYKKTQLHLVGKLQSNKAKKAVQLFHYIHSLDTLKLAEILNNSEKLLNKKCKYFIQINVGEEIQKAGVSLNQFESFYSSIKKNTNLDIIGLMCIPPVDQNPSRYFKILKNLSKQYGLKELSMGMSTDYLEALNNDSTFIRLGTVLFGERFIMR